MKRRNALQSMGLIGTHVLFPSILTGFVASCSKPNQGQPAYEPIFFNQEELDYLAQIIDIIIPQTKTLSASAVHTHHFLDEVFAKCMTPEEQNDIKQGLMSSQAGFEAASDKTAWLTDIDQKAFTGDEGSAWIIPIKQYSLIGFFTSKEGMTKASNYLPVPGDFKGEVPVDENTLNYGKTNQLYYL